MHMQLMHEIYSKNLLNPDEVGANTVAALLDGNADDGGKNIFLIYLSFEKS